MSDETVDNSSDESIQDAAEGNGKATVTPDGILQIYQAGELTVLGFGGRDVPSDFNVAHYREAILELLETHSCKKVAFDLTGVQIVPSGILGLWASLNQAEIAVEVYNPSEDICDVLEITKLNQLISIKNLDL